jgi:hypothetical protein
MLLNCKNGYFYLYFDKVQYRSVFPSSAIIVPNGSINQYLPITIRYIIDNKASKDKKHTFYCYDIVDYPFKVNNMIITAKKIDE